MATHHIVLIVHNHNFFLFPIFCCIVCCCCFFCLSFVSHFFLLFVLMVTDFLSLSFFLVCVCSLHSEGKTHSQQQLFVRCASHLLRKAPIRFIFVLVFLVCFIPRILTTPFLVFLLLRFLLLLTLFLLSSPLNRVVCLFCGCVEADVECGQCHAVSTSLDPFFDLSLDVRHQSSVTSPSLSPSSSSSSSPFSTPTPSPSASPSYKYSCTLYQCLDRYAVLCVPFCAPPCHHECGLLLCCVLIGSDRYGWME